MDKKSPPSWGGDFFVLPSSIIYCMTKRITILTLIMLTLSSLQLFARDDKKEWDKTYNNLVKILQIGEIPESDIPSYMLNDDKADVYALKVLSLTDEQYSQDTASANAIISQLKWILNNWSVPDEKMKKKLVKQQLDPEKLFYIQAWSNELLFRIYQRYDILKGCCEKKLRMRREARERTMPTGQLVCFSYRAYGSSHPTEFILTLERDAATQKWQLNGKDVDAAVADKVRTLVEENEVYKCMSNYDENPCFHSIPLKTGGPSSWSFYCNFEGGAIVSQSESGFPPENFSKVINYLIDVKQKL